MRFGLASLSSLSLSAGALIRVYNWPSIAGVLASTGRLIDHVSCSRCGVERERSPIQQVVIDEVGEGFRLSQQRGHRRRREARMGFDTSAGEYATLYRYWWHVAHLLGLTLGRLDARSCSR